VTPSFFQVLGVRPLLGRTFTEEEAVLARKRRGPHRGLWKDLFARDPHWVGKDTPPERAHSIASSA